MMANSPAERECVSDYVGGALVTVDPKVTVHEAS